MKPPKKVNILVILLESFEMCVIAFLESDGNFHFVFGHFNSKSIVLINTINT